MYELREYSKELNRCLQCNFCQDTCPVYAQDKVESSVARGRLSLIQATLVEKTIDITPRVEELVNRCLLCTSCMQGCPSGIAVDDIVISARNELSKHKGVGLVKKFVFRQVLNNRSFSKVAGKALATAKRLRLAPAYLPAASGPPFEERFSGIINAIGPERAKVAYFIGCATNLLYPDTGEAVIKVLRENGITVVVPDGLSCCGIPALAHGDSQAAVEAVHANADALASLDVDAIITDCTSCGYMLKVKASKVLAADDPYQQKVDTVSKKVVEVTEFITGLGLVKEPHSKQSKVTYHVPCHRSWSQGLVQAPRKLVSLIPEIQLVEMREPQKCCGSGGSFFVDHKELAANIRQGKLDDIALTGADAVITQCPACRMYLEEGVKGARTILHPVELLANQHVILSKAKDPVP